MGAGVTARLLFYRMKCVALVLSFFLISFGLKAQDDYAVLGDNDVALISITSHLRSTGHVAVYQDARLEKLVSTQPKTYVANSKNTKSDVIVSNGFRIRVYSGSQQTVSRNRAEEINAAMKKYDPELETYLIFKSPNWRLLVGNYTTNEEAVSALRKLKKDFPDYSKEMFVIKDMIEIKK
ncbi:MAG: SPOR domain-containing protein [Bacteroidales bacterium]|nr:SPOR domain-containing protein [Bacteroidales bacterium]